MEKRVDLNQNSTLIYKNDIPYISFKSLERFDFIRHGFSTRLGGVSEGCFGTMNLGFDRGDRRENVIENFRRIGEAVGFDYRRVVLTDQLHTANVRKAGEADSGKGIIREKDYRGTDGHITNVKRLPLLAYGADCVPVYFADPVNRAVGICHSGWKGTVNNISGNIISAMVKEYGTRPEDLITVIGPSICKDCYEISEDVALPFIERYGRGDGASGVVRNGKAEGKYMLDLWEANKYNLMWSGVREENICICGVCTKCMPELLFSHRRDGLQRGSMAGFICIQ